MGPTCEIARGVFCFGEREKNGSPQREQRREEIAERTGRREELAWLAGQSEDWPLHRQEGPASEGGRYMGKRRRRTDLSLC